MAGIPVLWMRTGQGLARLHHKPNLRHHSKSQGGAEEVRPLSESGGRRAGTLGPETGLLGGRPACLWSSGFTFSSQTSSWKHWDLTVSSRLPGCCLGPAGWLNGWRCHSLQRETPQLCSQGQTRRFSAWPFGRVAAEGSAGPRSGGG